MPHAASLDANDLGTKDCGLLVGQERSLEPKHVWSIRVRLEIAPHITAAQQRYGVSRR